MMKYYMNEGSCPFNDPKGLIVRDDGDELAVYLDGKNLGSVPLGTERTFRPDQDAMFISDNGRVWKPVN